MLAEVNAAVALWFYAVTGLAILFSLIAFCAFIVNGRHDEYLADLKKEADDKWNSEELKFEAKWKNDRR